MNTPPKNDALHPINNRIPIHLQTRAVLKNSPLIEIRYESSATLVIDIKK